MPDERPDYVFVVGSLTFRIAPHQHPLADAERAKGLPTDLWIYRFCTQANRWVPLRTATLRDASDFAPLKISNEAAALFHLMDKVNNPNDRNGR